MISIKNLLMGTMAAAVMVSCAQGKASDVFNTPYEECVYLGDKTEFAVWSPDAEAAELRLYRGAQDTTAFMIAQMKKSEGGIWKATIKQDLKGTFYTFSVKMNGEWLPETAGTSAKAVGVNGWRGAVIDWEETDPEGWEEDKSPMIAKSDIIVYEMHHRDFSIHQTSGVQNKGKYLALTEEGTKNPDGLATGVDHLKELGVTYVQLLPSTDFITVDEAHLKMK